LDSLSTQKSCCHPTVNEYHSIGRFPELPGNPELPVEKFMISFMKSQFKNESNSFFAYVETTLLWKLNFYYIYMTGLK
jgi:hypothetical protein